MQRPDDAFLNDETDKELQVGSFSYLFLRILFPLSSKLAAGEAFALESYILFAYYIDSINTFSQTCAVEGALAPRTSLQERRDVLEHKL